MTEPAYEAIAFEHTHDGLVAWVRLDRPAKMNALNQRLLEELAAALTRIEDDPDARVLVLTGNGEAFSAGYDLSPGDGAGEETAYEAFRREQANYALMKRIWEFPYPTVAAVNGYALAGGFELSQMTDLVVTAEDAAFGYPIVRGTGTPPVFFLPYVVGYRTARDLLLTGRLVSGAEAVGMGLANQAVEPADLEDAVRDLVEDVLRVPGDLAYLNKRMLNRAYDAMGYSSVLEHGHDLHITGHETPSVTEFTRRVREDGLAAALEWRDQTRKP